MLEYGVSTLQNKPSLFKTMDISKIVDKKRKQNLGYFVPNKYEKLIKKTIESIEKQKKINKLRAIKQHNDLEFIELGIDDGIE